MIKSIYQILKSIFLFGVLTILTQIGGLVYLIYKFLYWKLRPTKPNLLVKILLFAALYLFTTLLLVPTIAPIFGRKSLNWQASDQKPLSPHTYLTCLLNRHYVKAELEKDIVYIAHGIKQKFPGTELRYLDANFPFWDGFPLLPHRSHDDGEKLDIAFLYKDAAGKSLDYGAGLLGYGICEEPRKNEVNKPNECAKQGYWQYSFLKKITPQFSKQKYIFDEERNKELLQLMLYQKGIKKIFIEPHLKTRLGFQQYSKIRFHGCYAVRHDDHIHIQL